MTEVLQLVWLSDVTGDATAHNDDPIALHPHRSIQRFRGQTFRDSSDQDSQ